MNKTATLCDTCLQTMDYCLGMYGDDDFLYDEIEFEFYMHTNKPLAFKRIIFNAMVFTADMLLSL